MPRSSPAILALAALTALAALASSAAADPTADDWLRVGLERYELGNFIGAIDAFDHGYALDPRPAFLFAIGQAHRRRGDCDRARDYFDRFLTTSPTTAQAAAATDQRDRCVPAPPLDPSLTAAAAAAAAAAATTTPITSQLTQPPRSTAAHGRWRDPWLLGGTATGLTLAATGAMLLVDAHHVAADAAAAPDYDRHLRLRERADQRQLAGALTLGASAAVGALVTWRWLRTGDRAREHRVALTPVLDPTTGTAAVALGGRF